MTLISIAQWAAARNISARRDPPRIRRRRRHRQRQRFRERAADTRELLSRRYTRASRSDRGRRLGCTLIHPHLGDQTVKYYIEIDGGQGGDCHYEADSIDDAVEYAEQ